MRGDRGKKERLFRAAVTAFASLTRPSRNEIAKLEDLALPLYDNVSVEARRFVAAVLSEVANPPMALVRRLAEEKADISAPLLLRSHALSDVDLIGLIGRHGVSHARVIERRTHLNPTISQLVKALLRSETTMAVADTRLAEDRSMKPALSDVFDRLAPALEADAAKVEPRVPGAAAEGVRDRLRTMMVPAASKPAAERMDFAPLPGRHPDLYAKLRDSALTGVSAFFHTALADALEVDMTRARAITAAATGFTDLVAALKFLELSEDQAFVIAAALHPQKFGHGEAIRLLLERFRLMHREAAADRVRGWKAASLATAMSPQARPTVLPAPANSQRNPPVFGKALKAS